MKREINQYLLEWKDRSDRKPLIIRGARQVGKSYTVESIARQCFKYLVKINLEEKPEFRKLFDFGFFQFFEINFLYVFFIYL